MALPTTNLVARFIAGTGITEADAAGRVSQWDDQSGNANHATQATAGNQPYTAADGLARPVVKFAASSSTYLSLPGTLTALARSCSIWIVGRFLTAGSQSYASLVSYAANAAALRAFTDNTTASNVGGFNKLSLTIPPRFNPALIGVISGAAAAQVLSQITATSFTAVTNDATPRTIEFGRSPTGSSYSNFEAYEILVYSAAQSDADRDALIAYAVDTYGLRGTQYAKQIAYEGDSIAAGTGLGATEYSYPQQTYDAANDSWRQTQRTASGSTIATLTDRAASVDGLLISGATNVLHVLIGRNDVTTADNSATVYGDLVTYVQARVAAGWQVWVGTCIATGSTLQGTIDALNAKIRGTSGNGVIADAGASRVIDFAADPRFDATGDSSSHTYYQGDNTHPSAAGAAVMANIVKPHLASSGVTVSGPASGTAGEASTAFTVSRATGTFNGVESVTLTASEGTIDATATGGTITDDGTGTVTVKPADGESSFTFTYTPATSGARTIAVTNGQYWTNPANVEYESLDVVAPTLSDFATNTAGTEITATLSEAGCTPTSGSAGFTLSGTDATVASWAISGTTLTLTLTDTVYEGETVTLSYSAASGGIEDAANNALANITNAAVTNNSTINEPAGGIPVVSASGLSMGLGFG
jgi:lysophospholipase L1-like esterase